MKNYLLDTEFLKQLDYNREKETYVKIISLTNNEYPREQIEGRITGGSVNVDGASAVRRSCSLTMVTNENEELPMVTDAYWCYNNKFKLEIGLKNSVDKKYPVIVWFDMGIYVITSFSKSKNTNTMNISISGKDKMCRLNGEVSGNIAMTTDFGTIEYVQEYEEKNETTGDVRIAYNRVINKLPIYSIIQNAIREYGQEKAENIIINDLDEYGYELWEYRGDKPMYLFILQEENKGVINMTFNGDTVVKGNTTLSNFEKAGYKFYSMNYLDNDYNNNATTVTYGEKNCWVAKIENGETAGYHRIPLYYNNTLVLNAGETVTSLLDKLKNMLGNFEYFYDLQGRFVFQKKKDYVQELFSPVNGELVDSIAISTPYSYKFEDEQLFTSVSNTPNINNLKNDFAIWGTRASNDVPIHARYAIDKKPQKYVSAWERYVKVPDLYYIKAEIVDITSEEEFDNYTKELFTEDGNNYNLISSYNAEASYYAISERLTHADGYNLYQRKYNGNYEPFNPKTCFVKTETEEGIKYEEYNNQSPPYYTKINGNTGYSISEYDWRELIYQMAYDYLQHNEEVDFSFKLAEANPQFIDGKTGYEQYYSDIQGFWRQLYNPNPSYSDQKQYGDFYLNGDDEYWNTKIHLDPNSLLFWFDFLDTEGDLGNYSVKKVGSRSKVVNETAVKSIYFKETPEVLFIVHPKEQVADLEGTSRIPIWIQSNMEQLFYKSGQGLSAIAKANELINQYTANVESLSITSIPIYYLQPNTRIYIKDQGDFTIGKISYSLAYNGTMNISATKINKWFY